MSPALFSRSHAHPILFVHTMAARGIVGIRIVGIRIGIGASARIR
jgi:hypothetical protein